MLKEVRAEAIMYIDEDLFFYWWTFPKSNNQVKCNQESNSDTDWDIELIVNGSPVDFKINTGSDTTVMTEATFNNLQQKPKLNKSRPTVYSPGGKIRCMGKFLATTTFKGQRYQHWITVIKGQFLSLTY